MNVTDKYADMVNANDFFDKASAEVSEMLKAEGCQLRPINATETPQNVAETPDVQPSHDDDRTQSQPPREADNGFDFSKIENPETPPDDVRELPIWGLPTELQNVIEEVAFGYQCSRDYAVAPMMSATSTMLGKRVSGIFGNYKNYPNLWIAIIGRTASGKTAPLQFFYNPVDTMENEAYKNYQREFQQWNDNGNNGSKPIYRHCLINNPSDESVTKELSNNNGSICWKTDELRTMFESWGKYSKNGSGSIVGNLLSIFNYADVSVTRVNAEPIYIPEPSLNIIGGIQPLILKKIMGSHNFTVDGLFQRFLNVFPDYRDVPPYADNLISDKVRETWRETVDWLAHVSEFELRETDDARRLHIDAINRWRSECNTGYQGVEAMVSLLQKLEIHLCRWSIVVAVLSGERQITADNIRYSIECMDYFRLCGEKAFCLIANDSKPKELTNGELLRLFKERYPDLNQSKFADAIGVSQQYINKELKKLS